MIHYELVAVLPGVLAWIAWMVGLIWLGVGLMAVAVVVILVGQTLTKEDDGGHSGR